MFRRSRTLFSSPRLTSRRPVTPRRRLMLHCLEDRAVPATITVTNNNDLVAVDGSVSLREALNSINAAAPVNADVVPTGGPFGTADEVQFLGVVSPITLPTGQLAVSKSVLISGPGSALLTVQNTAAASATARVFNITAGTVNIVGLTVTGGNATSNGGGIATAGATTLTGVVVSANKTTTDGGGIAISAGSLTLNNCVVDSNQVTTANEGGGIRVAGTQTLTVNDTTVSNNSSGADGGGIYFFSGGTLVMNRSTVSGNKSHLLATGVGGGGIYLFNTTTTITNSTISGNSTATGGKSSPGGGIHSASGTAPVNIRNSTIAFNDAGTSKGGGFSRGATAVVTLDSVIISNNTATTDPDATGTVATANQSLIQNPGALIITTNNGTQLGVDPLLGALGTGSGGVTAYHVPGAGSPALDKGNNNAGVATDQRGPGFPRSQGGVADVGSFEAASPIPSASGGPYAPVTVAQPDYTFTVTYQDNDSDIDVSKLDNNDLQITGPGGPYGVSFVSNTPAGKTVTATYKVAPGGGFTGALNGPFTINVVAGEVFDTDIPTPLSVPAGSVGSFTVSIPTTFVVDAANDETIDTDGKTSLREAMAKSNSDPNTVDSITFDPGVFGVATIIPLVLGEMKILSAVTVTGPAAALTIDAAGLSRHFNVDVAGKTGQAVSFSNMTLTGGNAGAANGGAILSVDEALSLSKVTVTKSTTTVDGGGISINLAAGSLSLTDSVVSDNTATGEGGGVNIGGNSVVTITRTTLSGNSAGAEGGGIYFFSTGKLNMTDSTVSGNKANTAVAGNGGGGIYLFSTTTNITQSTISGNFTNTVGKESPGGGIAIFGATATYLVNINNSTIAFNDAGTKAGGGVHRGGGNTVTIDSTIITDNLAATGKDANGTFNISFSLLSSSAGAIITGAGNVLDVSAGLLPLALNGGTTANHIPTANAFNKGNNGPGLTLDQRGGPRVLDTLIDIGSVESPAPPSSPPTAVATAPNVTAPAADNTITVVYTDAETNIDVSKLDNNDLSVTGPGGPYGVSFVSSTPAAKSVTATYKVAPGGGFTGALNGTFTVNVVAGEVFDTDAPPLSVAAGAVGSFKVAIATNFVVNATNDESIDTDGKVSLREALEAANANVGVADSVSFDAVVFASLQTVTLALGQLVISDPVTVNGPAVGVVVDAAALSRVLNVDVAASSGNAVALSDMTLTNGSATTDGGGINNNDEALTLTRVTVSKNTTTGDGGGVNVALTAGSLSLVGSTLTGNSATGVGSQGGGANFDGGSTVTLVNSTVSDNTAGEDGGGLYFFFNGSLTVRSSTISGNKANQAAGGVGGGGIYFYGTATTMLIQNSTISGNTANRTVGTYAPYGYGGGVLLNAFTGTSVIQNSTIAGNDAGRFGAGIAQAGGAATWDSSIVATNKILGADAATGDVFFTAATVVGGDNNLIGIQDAATKGTFGALTQAGSLATPLDPLLAPLANNGGPTFTHKLLAGSPATNKGNNAAALANDQRGVGFARVVGSAADVGAYEGVPPTLAPGGFKVNGGGIQRSMVTSFVIDFTIPVSFPSGIAAAFKLDRVGNPTGGPSQFAPLGSVNISAVQTLPNQVTITFLAGGAVPIDLAGSLIDGRYDFTIIGSKITGSGFFDGDGDGNGGDDRTENTHRLFGDADGDADVDAINYGNFRAAFGTADPTFDFDGDGDVDAVDYGQFRQRFGAAV